jgi:hypothetical protein
VAFTLLLEFAKAICLLSSMFRVDATMRPLLMTVESRRVTLNGGDANFQSRHDRLERAPSDKQ